MQAKSAYYSSSAVLLAAGFLLWISMPQNAFVSPHFYTDNLNALLPPHGRWEVKDLLAPFSSIGGPGESRPRFLAYYFLQADYLLRAYLAPLFFLPPNANLALLPHALGVWFLFRIARQLGGDSNIARYTVALYLSSVGVVSVVGFAFMPGKGLVNVVFLACVYHSLKLCESQGTVWSTDRGKLPAWILAGMFLDESGLFSIVIPALVCPQRFIANHRPDWRALAYIASPLIAFAVAVLAVVPLISTLYFGGQFNYVRSILNSQGAAVGGIEIAGGFFGRMSADTFMASVTSPIASFIFSTRPAIAASIYAALVLLGAGLLSSRSLRLLALFLLFLLFIAAVHGRYGAVPSGHYYGAALSALHVLWICAVLIALKARTVLTAALALALLGSQSYMSYMIHAGSKLSHHALTVAGYRGPGTIDAAKQTSFDELTSIHGAWKDGQLGPYLAHVSISPGAAFLPVELETLTRLGYGPHR